MSVMLERQEYSQTCSPLFTPVTHSSCVSITPRLRITQNRNIPTNMIMETLQIWKTSPISMNMFLALMRHYLPKSVKNEVYCKSAIDTPHHKNHWTWMTNPPPSPDMNNFSKTKKDGQWIKIGHTDYIGNKSALGHPEVLAKPFG